MARHRSPTVAVAPVLHSLSFSFALSVSHATISEDAQSNQPQQLDMIPCDSVHGGELMDLPVTIQRHMNHGDARPVAGWAADGGVSPAFPPLHQLQSAAAQRSDISHEGIWNIEKDKWDTDHRSA